MADTQKELREPMDEVSRSYWIGVLIGFISGACFMTGAALVLVAVVLR